MIEVQSEREGPIRNGNKPCLANEPHQGKIDVEIIRKETQTSPQHQGLAREHRLLASPNYREQSIPDLRCSRASREIGNERHESSPFLSGRGHIAGPKVKRAGVRRRFVKRLSSDAPVRRDHLGDDSARWQCGLALDGDNAIAFQHDGKISVRLRNNKTRTANASNVSTFADALSQPEFEHLMGRLSSAQTKSCREFWTIC